MTGPWSSVAFGLTPLGRVAQIQLGKMLQPASLEVDDTEVTYLRAGSLASLPVPSELPTMFASLSDRKRFAIEAGDLLVAEGGDCGQSAFALEVPAGTIIQNSLHRVRSHGADLRFLRYCISAVYSSGWLEVLCNKSTFGHLTREKLASIRVPNPSREEQRAIADYLDRETQRIDLLVEKWLAAVALIRHRVGALLQHMIDETAAEVLPLRRVVDQFVDYRGATPEKSEMGVPLVTATNVKGGRIDLLLGEQFVSEDTYVTWMRRGFPEVGDVLITTEAPLGEVAAIVEPKVALAQRLILLKPNAARVSSTYLRLCLLSSRAQADLLSRASGSTVWGIRADRLRDVRVPVPDRDLQNVIVGAVTQAEGQCRSAQALVERQIELLYERRQALIAAAVTGQLPIPVPA